MAKFKCMLSGTIAEFKEEHDIEEMRKHPEYEEVNAAESKQIEHAKKSAEKK